MARCTCDEPDCPRCRRYRILAAASAGRRPGPCGGCGKREPLIVPEPPALSLKPRHARAVVTVAVGDEAWAMLEVVRPYLVAYADRAHADLVVLDWPGHPDWPMSAKFAIPRVFDHYDRIAYVDADLLLRPGCVDLFGLCDPDEFGACDELAWHRAQPQHGRERAYLEFRERMGFANVRHLPWYFNAGVMVCSRRHRPLLLPPTQPIRPTHCAEQDHTNAQVLDAFLRGEVRVRLLDRRANWQNWTDHGFRSATPDAVLHWSGAGKDRISRVEQMRALAELHPLPDALPREGYDPDAVAPDALPTWRIDRRHARWLHETLASGRFRRVLEIGCHQGYSTSAFLDALRAGTVDEVHLCDIAPTDELRSLLERSGSGDRVRLHECRSVELLDRDGRWDLVFVDGDHTAATVSEEARLLLGAGVGAVFAHDTAAAGRYAGCEGPAMLKQALQAAGYRCLEDCLSRPGERTDRGMLFAARDRGGYEAGLAAYRRACVGEDGADHGGEAGSDTRGVDQWQRS